MDKDIPNKAMKPGDIKTKVETFHFSGGGHYHPMSIEAQSLSDALEIWDNTKKTIN